ncbi:glycosyltransferase [Humibacter ginsengiterrae]
MPAVEQQDPIAADHSISVVIPVYQGESTLRGLIDEIRVLTSPQLSQKRHAFVVSEIILVYDNGPDGSAAVIRELEATNDFVRCIWLSRNYGQHAATLAGMASAGSDWIVTLDEDGQHDPSAIGTLLDAAMQEQAAVVYARPTNSAPHGALRNSASKTAKWLLARVAGVSQAVDFQSFRLVLGNVGRSVAAYSGSGVYLDIALSWVAGKVVTAPVALREEGDRRSGYSARRLFGHFLRLVLSSGTRVLRLVAFLGLVFAAFGVVLAIIVFIERLAGGIAIEGWASTIVILLLSSGAVLFSLGIIAEYIGINVNMAMGKPPYLVVSDPGLGPLGRRPRP